MAFNIPQLRQNNIFDQYGMDMSGMDPGFQQDSNWNMDPGFQQDSNWNYDPAFQDVSRPPQSASEMPDQIQPPVVPAVPTYGSTPPPQVDPNDPYGIKKIMDQYYTPQTQASDRLNHLLDTAPDYKNYNPGALRTIGAMGMSLGPGGFKGAEDALYSPLARDFAAWKEEATPFQQAATLENQQNINERTLAGNIATSTVNARRADQQNMTNEEKNQIARQKNEVMLAIANIKGTIPDFRGENVLIKYPDGTVRDTGVKTTNFSPIERANIEATSREKVANIVASTSQANTQARGWIEVTDAQGNVYRINPQIQGKPIPQGDAPPKPVGPVHEIGTTGPKTTSPGDTEKNQVVIANTILSKNPDLQPFITITGNIVTMTPPKPGWTGGVSADLKRKYDLAQSAIFGSQDPLKPGTTVDLGGGGGEGNQQPKIQHSPSTGKYRISYDGGKTWQPYTPGGGE